MAIARAYASFKTFIYAKITADRYSELKAFLKFAGPAASNSAESTPLAVFVTEEKDKIADAACAAYNQKPPRMI